jgi:hypothetical protein
MRYLSILLISILFISCKKKNEFREDPEINHTLELAVDANVGKYLATGKIGENNMDSLDILVSKIDGSTILLSSSQFPSMSIPVNNLTDYGTYSSPGGSGLNLVASNSDMQFSIFNASMLLKYKKDNIDLDLAAKKIQ